MNEVCPVCCLDGCVSYSDAEWAFDGKTYRLMQCPACGCAYTTPMPSDDVLKRLYATSFDYRWYQDHYAAKLRDCEDRVEEYLPVLGKRVLDYGGGLGYFSRAAREKGMGSVTYDPYVGGQVLPEGGWDAVVSLHMLEHSNDLDRTVEHMKSFLAPGGRLILAVPNFEGDGYKTLGMRWVWAQPPLIHIFHFTARGVSTLLERHGFKDVQISYTERWDANNYCDVTRAEWFMRWDRAWGIRPLNRFVLYRTLVAKINALRRFRGLKRALLGYHPSDRRYSELQVVAVLAAT